MASKKAIKCKTIKGYFLVERSIL